MNNEKLNIKQSPIDSLLHILTPLLVFFLSTRTPNDNDMWWHLRAGQEMVMRHQILTTDAFSFTRIGAQWINAFWLSDIGIYGLFRLGGFFALTFAAACLITLIMVVIFKHSLGPTKLIVCLILIGSLGMSPFSGVRPQLISFLLLAILDLELTQFKQSGKPHPWFLVLLFVLWANTHGGFIWGFLLLGAFIVGQIFNRLMSKENALSWNNIGKVGQWGLIAALSTLINPNGITLWKLPFYTVGVSITKISEWASPDFHRMDMQPMLWFIFLFIIGIGFAKTKLDWGDALKFIGFSYLAFVSQRSIGPFIVVAIPVVSKYLTLAWNDRFKDGLNINVPETYQRKSQNLSPRTAQIINGIIILALGLVVIGRAYWVSRPALVYSEYPVKAVNWVKTHKPTGSMFNSYNWGGFLTWELPEYPVFIDGRADLYGDELINGWWDVVNGTEKGLKLLDDWQIQFALLEPGWPIIRKLPTQGWHYLYQDTETVILGR
jgi:hypothetical protein